METRILCKHRLLKGFHFRPHLLSSSGETVSHFLQAPIEGVVLQCYGAGNVPTNRKDIMQSIKEAVKRGVIILSVTQCSKGGVSPLYETGKALVDIGKGT